MDDEDFSRQLTQAIKGITRGIAPHAGKEESEEYRRNVPVWLRNNAGLPGDEVAALLATQHPELGIETEDDLMQALGYAANLRTLAKDNKKHQPAVVAHSKPAGFDAQRAREAVQSFAFAVSQLDQSFVDQLREAWKSCYSYSGHKALARYLVTGNVEAACKSFDKMGVGA